MSLECIRTCASNCPHVMLSLEGPDVRTSVWVALGGFTLPEMAPCTRRPDPRPRQMNWSSHNPRLALMSLSRCSGIWIFGCGFKILFQWAYWRVWQSVALMKEPIIQNKLCASVYPPLPVSAVNCQFSVIDICEIKGGLVRKLLFHVGKSGRFTGW